MCLKEETQRGCLSPRSAKSRVHHSRLKMTGNVCKGMG